MNSGLQTIIQILIDVHDFPRKRSQDKMPDILTQGHFSFPQHTASLVVRTQKRGSNVAKARSKDRHRLAQSRWCMHTS